ncbi:hypothetical protein BJ978_001498 [Agromyces terreus]|uniref:DUF2207 domain-containing protein n=1 Tax=Agromyces terreus TaxID=424795 RepID=A0A9X2GY89_9MICO|nr:DUF2207 domain-containing protein [Agromyces terreus]MCP2370822.1 hypothetical protein [Agromyces terreus]
MLPVVIVLAAVPALLIFALGVTARIASRQPVSSPVVQYTAGRGSSILRDALLVDADRRAVTAVLIDLAVTRRIRILAGESKRDPIGIEMQPGATFTAEELSVLEALFGPEHTSGRVRRFTSDRRALSARLKAVVRDVSYALAREGLVAKQRVAWPGTTLTVLAYLGMLVEGLFIIVALVAADWPALVTALAALAVTIATIIVTPSSWRKFLPPARERREHLDGLRQYLELAERNRLRALQSPTGAELIPVSGATEASSRTDAAGPADPAGAADAAGPAPLARFHLHEKLLPFAVLFGVERGWIDVLKLDLQTLERTNLDTLADLVDGTAELAVLAAHLGELVVLVDHVGDLAASVGDLVDVSGGIVDLADGIGGVLGIFE